MDIGAVRPLPSYTVHAVPRVAETDTQTSQTDLPEEATVRQPPASAESRPSEHHFQQPQEDERDSRLSDELDRRIEQDPSTETFVYQAIDTESGEVVSQVPNDSLLKLRAYVETMTQSAARHEEESSHQDHQDLVDRTA